MDFAVLVKVVPAVEQIRFDPDRKTMIRTGVPWFLNPYDSRAVRVAVQLRRTGERVTVLSMGPPAAATQLRETFAFGADRVLLLTDPALAGSDTWVTARVLTQALRSVGHHLVLVGERSIDSDTGQVGPEVAALLGVPVLTAVRRLSRTPDRDEFEAVAETGTGWNRFRITSPAVVTVSERILRKSPPPTAAERARAQEMTVETAGIRELGLSTEQVGLEGSPTFVRKVVNEEPERHPRVFAEGGLESRIDGAAAAAEELLRSPPPRPAPWPPLSFPLPEDREVLVLVSGPTGVTDPASLGVLSELRRLAPHLWPSAVWVGPIPPDTERLEVAQSGAIRGYLLPTDRPFVGSRTAAHALDQLIQSRPAVGGVVLLAHAYGREVGGQLAARRGLGLTGDAVGVTVDPSGNAIWRKPAFGGGFVASISSRTRPSLATVRPGALTPTVDRSLASLPIQELPKVPSDEEPELVESGQEADARWGDLGSARVVLIAGMGLGGPENLSALQPALSAWKAALGGTRRVIDAGWLPGSQQVGLTGRSVAADLAVLVGVSGAGNHLVGLRRTRVLLAVNPDPAAPVFRQADVGIVGPWAEVLPPLTDRLASLARARSVGGS